MGAGDGAIVGLTKIVTAGSNAGKWNLVIVAEGYRAAELRAFGNHAYDFATTLLNTAPFNTLTGGINVFRLDVSSTDSGADNPVPCGGDGAVKRTFFDASFCNSGLQRLLKVDRDAVVTAVTDALPEQDAIAVIVNSPLYGGSGDGQVATMSLAPTAHDIGLHELGHTAFDLADEYADGRGTHRPIEPEAPNITIQKTLRMLKWKSHVKAGTPIPTGTTPGCGGTLVAPAQYGIIGTYEGARLFDCRVYRPSPQCKMHKLQENFCAVCSEYISAKLAKHVAAP